LQSIPRSNDNDANQGIKETGNMQLKPRKILLAFALAAAAVGTSAVSTASQAGTLAINIAYKGASQRAVWT
jgi:hypothetical protein